MTRVLLFTLALAALANGVLAGINLDRYIVQEPAFRRLSRASSPRTGSTPASSRGLS